MTKRKTFTCAFCGAEYGEQGRSPKWKNTCMECEPAAEDARSRIAIIDRETIVRINAIMRDAIDRTNHIQTELVAERRKARAT